MRAVLIAFFFLFCFPQCFSLGSGGLEMSPAKETFNFSPNKTIEGSFSLENLKDEGLDLLLFVSGNIPSEEYLGAWDDLGEFVELESEAFTLAPGESREVFYSLKMPSELKKGLHRAKIVVKPVPREEAVGASFGLIFQLFVESEGEQALEANPSEAIQEGANGMKSSGTMPVIALAFIAVLLILSFWLKQKLF